MDEGQLLRLLIVDDDADVLTSLETILRREVEVVCAHNGLDALEKLERVEPDMLILDVAMPCLDGFDTALSIRKNASFAAIPILFLTAAGDPASIEKGRQLKAAVYATKPFDPQKILSLVRDTAARLGVEPRSKAFACEEILAAEREGRRLDLARKTAEDEPEEGATAQAVRPRLLVVDDEPDVVALIESFLAPHYEVLTATRANDAIEKIVRAEPDLVLLDIEMPRLSGYQLSQLLKLNAGLGRIKVMFVSSRNEPQQVDYAYRLGAEAYLTKPFTPEDLLAEVRQIVGQAGFSARPKKRTLAELKGTASGA
jgi:CheY-like chemotaxis protein